MARKKSSPGRISKLQFIDLPGYSIKMEYPGGLLDLRIILQIPKILIQINRESAG